MLHKIELIYNYLAFRAKILNKYYFFFTVMLSEPDALKVLIGWKTIDIDENEVFTKFQPKSYRKKSAFNDGVKSFIRQNFIRFKLYECKRGRIPEPYFDEATGKFNLPW